MKMLELFGVRVEMPGNQPIVLLRDVEGDKYLPIWIGSGEASAIALAQQGIQASRPLTHDLINSILEVLGHKLVDVVISDLKDGIFHAILNLEGKVSVSARPSDAITLAIKAQVPIFCSDEVLEAAGIEIEETADSEEEVERFREFLENINPEDFS
jgi:bifunctional DNase/RNase